MDNAEFLRLLSSCENALKRFVYYKTPTKEDGDDVLQETLLAAYRRRDSVKSADSFKTWLFRIAQNKCHDFYRERGGHPEICLDGVPEHMLSQSLHGLTVAESVRETLDSLPDADAEVLRLFFLQGLSQAEIACALGVPVGTVKSRLHTAKRRFRAAYPFPPSQKGDKSMSKLPDMIPGYTIVKSDKEPFPVKWEEMMGWFIVPKLHEKISWAMYDDPDGLCTERYDIEVAGRASVHGIEGVEIIAREYRGGEHESNPDSREVTRTFVAQLTDTHCRILSESHRDGDVKRFFTFLDGDDFLPNWGFGEDNCGNEVNLKPKGIIKRGGNIITAAAEPFLLDAVGRYDVAIGGRTYDTVCVMDVNCYNSGVVSEQFLDRGGRTVLWRRFNRDDWRVDVYGQRWSERLPSSERLHVNGETYVHWYDCITDYIL
ncbi:MAG: RNA polymerase sigma factor [Oscillospiraceae bacterium]|nr:RNA polymerase sigma factor [Oscillospiraceae bacterium]